MNRIAILQSNAGVPGRYVGDLGIAYLAGHLRSNGHSIKIFDRGLIDQEHDLISDVVDFKPEAVLVKVWGFDYASPARDIEMLRDRIDARFIIGGQTVTVRPERSLLSTSADLAVIGDGIPAIDFALNGDTDKQGIGYWKDGKVISNGRMAFEPDNWPSPYYEYIVQSGDYPSPLVSSLGCWYSRCSFCIQKDLNDTIKFRSPENVMKDMRAVLQAGGRGDFYFYDDNFLNKPDWVSEITGSMDRARLGKSSTISFEARADDILRAEVYLEASKARIRRVDIGAESFLQPQLDRWNKGTTIEQNKQAFELLLSLGIEPGLYFMSGDHETGMDEIEQIAELLVKNPLFLIFGLGFQPLQDFEEASDAYPDYFRVFSSALLHLEKLSAMGSIANIRQKIVTSGADSVNPAVLSRLLKYRFDTLMKIVRDVEKGSLGHEEGLQQAQRNNLDIYALVSTI